MRFYSGQHRFYCGIDLHTRTLSLCVLDSGGAIVCEATLPPEAERLVAVNDFGRSRWPTRRNVFGPAACRDRQREPLWRVGRHPRVRNSSNLIR